MTWTYRLENVGDVTLVDVTIIDDAGTPHDPSDDIIVLIGETLEPGQVVVRSRDGVIGAGSLAALVSATGNSELGTATDSALFDVVGVAAPPPSVDPPLDMPAALPNSGSGGVADFTVESWPILVAVLAAISALALTAGTRLTRRSRPR